jgi:hypothetical protein
MPFSRDRCWLERWEIIVDKSFVHRWFHTLVISGASLSACGNEQVPAEARKPLADVASPETGPDDGDGQPADASSLADAGAVEGSQLEDAHSDFRCCIITK